MRRRNKLRTCIHLIWATKNRLPLVTADIEQRLYRYIGAICVDKRCSILAIGGMPDHIHLLVVLASTISLADLVKQVKGGSSRFVSESLKPGEWFAWQPNYAAFSVSPADKDRVAHYIQNQKQHHSDGTVWADEEETDEEDPTESS